MKRVLILVEGQTEETFVRDVLNPHFHERGIDLNPTLVVTKRVKDGPNFKGGITRWEKVLADLQRLSRDSHATAITTMFDYYGLPLDFPGMCSRPPGTPQARVEHVQRAMAGAFADPRFIPFLLLHEFEALVFASLEQAAFVFDDDARVLSNLRSHLATVTTPENINEGPMSAPSKRICKDFPRYDKVLQGPMAVEASGVDVLRSKCPHFSSWLSRLEVL